MDRRKFLSAMGALGVTAIAGAFEPKANEVVKLKRPHELFTQIEIGDGELAEFPLDLPASGTEYLAFTVPNFNRQPAVTCPGDWTVIVPMYPIGGEADTVEAVLEATALKLDSETGRLLLATGQANRQFPSETLLSLVGRMRAESPEGVEFCVYEGWLIGVKSNQDQLVMPIRAQGVFRDPRSNCYYGWGEYGFAVLKKSVVMCGKILGG